MVIGRLAAAHLTPVWGLGRLLLVSSVGSLFCSSLFFLIDSLAILYGFMLLIGILMASLWPSIQAFATQKIPVDATVLMILLSCFGVSGCSLVALLMGILGDQIGLHKAFIVAPLCLALAVSALLCARASWASPKGEL